MRIADFGALEGEIVLFGGPVSNLQAFEALEKIVGAGLAICTGDVVAYCADPGPCVARLRALGWPVIAGNCERQLATGAADCGCGFGDGSLCDRYSGKWYAHAGAGLTPADLTWMRDLPDIGLFRAHDRRWAVVHGGVTTINRFLWSVSPEAAFAEEIAALEQISGSIDGIIAGHSGIAFVRRIGGVPWINAGNVGMPPNRGRPETEYIVLGPLGARIARLSYDAESAAAAMRAAGLTQGYDEALLSGWWPSEEVLPLELRRGSTADDVPAQAP